MRRNSPPFPDDPIYRAILFVLVLSVLAGALLALAGEAWFHDEGISRLGGWIAVICGGLYFFFRWLGRRAAHRTRNGRRADTEDTRDE